MHEGSMTSATHTMEFWWGELFISEEFLGEIQVFESLYDVKNIGLSSLWTF